MLINVQTKRIKSFCSTSPKKERSLVTRRVAGYANWDRSECQAKCLVNNIDIYVAHAGKRATGLLSKFSLVLR